MKADEYSYYSCEDWEYNYDKQHGVNDEIVSKHHKESIAELKAEQLTETARNNISKVDFDELQKEISNLEFYNY